MNSSTRPILVTGSNRSGTTWVGRMLCHSGALSSVHEPFNSTEWPRVLEARLGGHYTHVPSTGRDQEIIAAVRRTIAHRTRYRLQLAEVTSPRNAAKLVRHAGLQLDRRRRHRRTLLKDPIALCSAGWLADQFDLDVVVMIRHPAGYVSSSARLGWRYDFEHLLSQHELVDSVWSPYVDQMRAYSKEPPDPFAQAIIMWNLLYSVVAAYQPERPSWQFIRYEDLAGDPMAGFERLYERLGLAFSPTAAALIAADTDAANPAERSVSEAHNTTRNSQAAAWSWVGRLDATQIAAIRSQTEPLSEQFYDDDTWRRATT